MTAPGDPWPVLSKTSERSGAGGQSRAEERVEKRITRLANFSVTFENRGTSVKIKQGISAILHSVGRAWAREDEAQTKHNMQNNVKNKTRSRRRLLQEVNLISTCSSVFGFIQERG